MGCQLSRLAKEQERLQFPSLMGGEAAHDAASFSDRGDPVAEALSAAPGSLTFVR